MSFFSISEGSIGFPLFGSFHLCWLIGLSLFALLGYKPFLEQKKFYFFLPLVPLGIKSLRYLILISTHQFYSFEELPFHLCNISLVVYFIYGLTKKKFFEEYIFAVAMPAALIALLVPGFGNLPTFSYFTMESFLSHGILVIYPLYLLASRSLIPNPKKLPKLFLVLVMCAFPIHYINVIFNTNFCYIERPLENTPLVFFDGIFGLKYQFGLMILIVILWIIWYSLYYFVVKIQALRLKRKLKKDTLLS